MSDDPMRVGDTPDVDGYSPIALCSSQFHRP